MQVFEKRLYYYSLFPYTSSNLTIHFLELWLCPHMEMVCTGCNGVDGAHVCSSVRFEDQASKAQAAQALVLPSQVATPGEISLKSLA